MKQETKSNLEVILTGLIMGILAFLFFKNKEKTKPETTEKPADYSEKDMI